MPFHNALVRFQDSDIFFIALLTYEKICGNNRHLSLQYLNETTEIFDLNLLRVTIKTDTELAHFAFPIQSLLFSILFLGYNNYTGRLSCLSNCDSAFGILKLLTTDLACPIDENSLSQGCFPSDHYSFLEKSGVNFTVNFQSFVEFIKIFFIMKNEVLFAEEVNLPVPKNIQKWRKPLLESMMSKFHLKVDELEGKKGPTVKQMKIVLQSHFNKNPSIWKTVLEGHKTDDQTMFDIPYKKVADKIWVAKEQQKDWCPTEYQLSNFYGRIVYATMIFCVAKYIPNFDSLKYFGYLPDIENESITLNLDIKYIGNTITMRQTTSLLKSLVLKGLPSKKRTNFSDSLSSEETSNNSKKNRVN